jgi:hypothetical protein
MLIDTQAKTAHNPDLKKGTSYHFHFTITSWAARMLTAFPNS